MKRVVVFSFISCIFLFSAHSQDLLKSRRTSYLTYVYKLTEAEAEKVFQDRTSVDSTYMHTLLYSYPTDSSDKNILEPGHYIRVRTRENNLVVNAFTVYDYSIRILNNQTDMGIQLYDKYGNIIPDALLKLNNRIISFDKKSNLYRLPKTNKKGNLKVFYYGMTTYYHIDKKFKNSRFKRLRRNFCYRTPVKYVIVPVKFTVSIPFHGIRSLYHWNAYGSINRIGYFFGRRFEKLACKFNRYYCDHPRYHSFKDDMKGYIVFNKPKYRQNDTVKVKAFITNWKGKPVDDDVEVVLMAMGRKNVIASLTPYRKGGYSVEFVLHDSLKLQLDRNYSVSLVKKNGYNLITGYFKYEDYELKSVQLNARLEKQEHYKEQSQHIFIKATDENGLVIPGARTEVKVEPDNISAYFNPYVFIPDVLWKHEQKLDPIGETKIEIPDSVFTLVNMSYKVTIDIYSSDNEHKSKTLTGNYFYHKHEIKAKYINDSVTFVYQVNGKLLDKNAGIISRNISGKIISEIETELPYTMKINPFTANYVVSTDSLNKTITQGYEPALLECYAQRIGDSIKITSENPRKIPFHYYIYKRNKEIMRGYGDSVSLIDRTTTKNPYYISLQYMWGGNIKDENYEIPLKDRELNIEVEQPDVIYPGQEVTINVNVKDYKNQPAENVDITAFSLTDKFEYSPPGVPDFQKNRKRRDVINTFSSADRNTAFRNQYLDYEKWKRIASIDSIQYYKFLYPGDTIFSFIDTMQSGITQFAPFVMRNGNIMPVIVIYVDYKPVYFSWSQSYNPYSVKIRPGYHQVKLRTSDREITLSHVYFPAGKKLIFSIEDNIEEEGITSEKMGKYLLTPYEKTLFTSYMFPYRNTFGEYYAYLRQDDKFIMLNDENTNRSNGYVGPVDPYFLSLKTTRGDSLSFIHEQQYEYDYSPEILKMRSKPKDYFSSSVFINYIKQPLTDSVLTEKEILQNWQQYKFNKRRMTSFYLRELASSHGYSELQLNLKSISGNNHQPLNIIVKPVNENWLRVYEGNHRKINLFEGDYYVILLFPGNKYFRTDIISLKKDGLNYVEVNVPDTLKSDRFGKRLEEIIDSYVFITDMEFNMEYELLDVFKTFGQYPVNPDDLILIKGKVLDHLTKQPITTAQIRINGTDVVHYTDRDGEFRFYAPVNSETLSISNSWYTTMNIKLDHSLENILVYMDRIEIKTPARSTHSISGSGVISGIVRDASTGEPLPGVNVVIKGTTSGTVSDVNGRYAITLPSDESEVLFSFLGYTVEEVNFYDRTSGDINLMEDIVGLEEVVVIGYGVQKRSYLTGAVSSVRAENFMSVPNALQGRVPGIAVKGTSSLENGSPLYIVNGVPVTEEAYNELVSSGIHDIQVLKDAAAESIYGSRGANGVILITTDEHTFDRLIEKHPPLELEEQTVLSMLNIESSSIRDNFSDYAFWQPTLTTDSDGKASFTVTFPDDVTKWNTYYLAMNGEKQSGQTKSGIKSYKPLMAQLSVPRFLVEGDTAGCIGKVINYMGGSVTVDRTFEKDSNIVFTKNEKVKNSIIDTLNVVAQVTDSITLGYNIKTENGYFDGEKRDIPVFRRGVQETLGDFKVLNYDTSFTIKVSDTLSSLKIMADANMMDVIANESKHIINYRYLCNEQLASKLKALLIEKKICEFKHVDFANEKHVLKIIDKLIKNQNENSLWGWWNVSQTSYWISTHVLEALFQAREMGYKVDINDHIITDYLVYQLSKAGSSAFRLELLELLRLMGAEFGFQKEISMIEKDTLLSVTERFRLIELKQHAGLEYSLDTIFKYKETTLFGSMYFNKGLYRYYIADNPVQLTLMAYRILRNDSVGVDTLKSIRNYFFENRRSGHWLNTYESSEIISTIFPDIHGEKDNVIKPKLEITGDVTKVVDTFPYQFELDSLDEIQVKKTGDFPVYFSTFTRFWNKTPDVKDDIFEVHSYFDNLYSSETTLLEAGKKVTLQIELIVKKTADYVMLEIPIPAGCSYEDKVPYTGYEIHREYFKNYTAVFYSNLPKGRYRVDINLMPRYTGTYTLNPAKAEQMYFPVFYGRNRMKRVEVR